MLLEVKNLHFSYGTDRKLFNNLNLRVDEGKIIALAGESGCGKSTLLNIIYGLLDWQEGEIIFNGRKLLGPKGNIVPGESEMKFVAQNYDLMPYSTAYDNVGIFISNINLAEKREKVMQLLEVVGMEDYADVKPRFLSGGQQQRIAIARALSVMPKLLLLDEPFCNLDFSRKIELRERLFNYVKKHNISLMISTHEIQEVMPWLNQIIILQEGRLIQNDSPEETYKNPYNEYVAKLFGEVNVLSDEEKSKLSLSKNLWYPTQIKISENGTEAKVLESRFAGSHYWNRVLVNEVPIVIYSENQLPDTVKVRFQ
ncbi:ABC transporter ATP-binding protein [Chryseobacterium taklimakanense]|uniref:sulfate/molybdate ABC transporter ATP-binding protein n=1 Tax=Chryseobacterium taklimakanense TaxID=536441 RepID=UPI001EF3E48E|nr:ABC transporter ATP-binding protein [Chryseobacterium taklimakanense]MCG7280167.1 ABC transporter ATP-binding protein [Chryseobacterium taklimakanense]